MSTARTLERCKFWSPEYCELHVYIIFRLWVFKIHQVKQGKVVCVSEREREVLLINGGVAIFNNSKLDRITVNINLLIRPFPVFSKTEYHHVPCQFLIKKIYHMSMVCFASSTVPNMFLEKKVLKKLAFRALYQYYLRDVWYEGFLRGNRYRVRVFV